MDNTPQTINKIDNAKIVFAIECDTHKLNKHILITKNELTIITQNIRSIYRNLDDFQILLSQLEFEPDILVMTKCRINNKNSIPLIYNYTSFASSNNLNQNYGLVMYIKNLLKANVKEIILEHVYKFRNKYIE